MQARTEIVIKKISGEPGGHSCHRIELTDRADTFSVPVIVSSYDALPVIEAFERKPVTRPHVHDLFVSFIELTKNILVDASIVRFEKGVFHARLSFIGPSGSFDLDSRVSDALALTLRCNAPVFMENSLIAETGDFKRTDDRTGAYDYRAEIRRLEKKLEQLVVSECYEDAARVRDKINDLKKQNDYE